MQIRHTQTEDLPRLLAIYEHARAFMAETGNPKQWGATHWPPESVLVEDIAAQRSYVCTDETQNDRIVGTFCYFSGERIDATYDTIEDGQWLKDAPYGVVHRIASDGTKGVGSFCIRWALDQCGYLRIDTHPDNRVMQNLLNKLGFTRRGVIYVVEDNDPRAAFDKAL